MNDDLLTAPGDPSPKWNINFNTRASLSRPIFQPTIIDDPVGLVGFGDSSALYFAQVTDPGAAVYTKLPTIKAKTYIHGWTANSGRLYVLDGVELSAWDIRDGQKRESVSLLTGQEAQKATDALAQLQQAEQKFEWATLLELAEDDWLRITAKQSAAQPFSAERDQLDILAADFFRMLKGLREMTGSTGGAVAARQRVTALARALADKRTEVGPWCFSPPIVRRHSFEENQRGVFMVQGDGRLYACDKALTKVNVKKQMNHAELRVALLEDLTSPVRLVAYVSDGSLCLTDAKDFADMGTWTPDTKPAKGTTHTLSAVNKQFWWGTDSGVYACEYVAPKGARPVWSSGLPWVTRQVGRLNTPVSPYKPALDPNELFDRMNVRGWIEQRANKSAPLTDGMTALLMLSDDAGKYKTAPEGTSYIAHGPFERDAASVGGNRWSQLKPHHSNGLVLLCDSRGASSLCRFPTASGVTQLTPQWTTAPWFSVTFLSALDTALSQPWPTPALRPLTKPRPDMIAWLKTTAVKEKVDQLANVLSFSGHKPFGDMDLRFTLWQALYDNHFPQQFMFASFYKDNKVILDTVFTAAEQQALATKFGRPGTVWNYQNDEDFKRNWAAAHACEANFDPPWSLKSFPANLFHSTPPLWYDPWGYNRPGDFITEQPAGTYLDPVCFNGHVKVPHRGVNFDAPFKGRRWAVFTDNDPGLILKTVNPPTGDEPQEEQQLLGADPDPNSLVITADEDRQRTIFQVLAPKPLRITFDAATHTLRNEATDWGSIANQVLAAPVMYLNPSSAVRATPTAWCVTAPEFPSARLRGLATIGTTGTSLFDKFLADNRTQYGPTDGSKTWQIERCPLPENVRPLLVLQGYGLPS